MNDQPSNEERKVTIKPDIIIEYSVKDCYDHSMSVIYVRPETNAIPYEKSIISGIRPFADVVYMANLNGKIFIRDALIFEHYSSQYKFAIYGKDAISKHPEMVKKFENHFNIKFDNAKIIGSFEAIKQLNMTPSELFNTFVDSKDFIRYYGQTIKKIKDIYIVNYDLPELIKIYDTDANVFIIVVRFPSKDFSFTDINKSIREELKKDEHAPIIDEDKFKSLGLNEIVKRTYHISSNHITAMFDMTDFVFKKDDTHLSIYETPLGRKIIDKRIATNDQLRNLKNYPLVKIKKNGSQVLVNISDEATGKNIDECIELINNIIF